MSTLLRSYSPPSVAIEIASRRITVAELAGGAGKATVTAFASEPLVNDAVMPALVGPNIAQIGPVAESLRRALERAGLRGVRRAALVVPDTVARVSLLPFEQLPAKQAEAEQLVRWQLKKSMPFPIEEAQVTFFDAHVEASQRMVAAVVARRDVIQQYESVLQTAGVHAGVVDLASFSVMNGVLSAGASNTADALVVCVAAEATTLAILRGSDLMFYRHRASVEEEPLSALVHQTAMYHEDRLGGTKFGRVLLCGAALAGGGEQFRAEIAERLSLSADAVDIRSAATVREGAPITAEVLDALAAPVGALLRERKAA